MIDTTKFFYNKDTHTELAEQINVLARQKGVEVSRWQNNSKNRVKITYHVHTGERNDFGSRQENVQFTQTAESNRNGKIYDETAMMHEIIRYLNSLSDTSESTVEYNVTSELIEAYEPVTFEDIASIVEEWDYEGWTLKTELKADHIRVYAYRNGSEEITPSVYTDWTMVTPEYGYIVVAETIA